MLIGLLTITIFLSFLPIMAVKDIFSDFQNLNINKGIFSIFGLLIAIGIMFFDYRKLKKFGYWFYGAGIGLMLIIHLSANQVVVGEPVISIGLINIQTWMALPLLYIAWATLLTTSTIKLWQGIILFLFSAYVFILIGNLPMFFIYIVLVGVFFVQSKFSRKEKIWGVSSVSVVGIGFVLSSLL